MKKVEKYGTNTIRSLISDCPLLDENIKDGDKSITWDGNIELYKDNCEKKSNLECIIDVQIKARVTDVIKQNIQTTFPLDRADLKNYLCVGGTMLILVKIVKRNSTEIRRDIYIKNLLPFDINKLLKESSAKKVSVPLDLLIDSSPMEFQKSCQRFALHKSKQACMNFDFDCDKIKAEYMNNQLELFDIAESKDDFFKNVLSVEQYVYVNIPSVNIPVVIDKVKLLKISENIDKQIKIGNKIFYKSYNLIRTESNIVIVKIGKSIVITTNDENSTINLNLNFNGTLNERIIDIEFIIELFYKKEFMISNSKFPLDFTEKSNFNIQAIQDIHEGLLKFKELLKKLNVKKDINLDNMNDQDKNYINILLDGILVEKNIPLNLDTRCKILLLPVLDIKLALFIQKQQDGAYKISNIFSDWCEKDGIKAVFTLDNGKGYELLLNNIFIMLNMEYYKCDNFDSNIVFKKLTEIKGNENYYNSVVQVVLNLINAYDSCSNIVLLDLADRLIDWLNEELGNINVNVLNKIQIKSRRGKIDSEDYKKLLQIKENDNDKTIKLGASILLKSKHEVDYYYSQLSNDVQNSFKKYPIYNLL